jgi:hypothetical protein
MTQYYVVLKSGTWEYVYAYGYEVTGGRYVFDIGHGNKYYITAKDVASIEVLQ